MLAHARRACPGARVLERDLTLAPLGERFDVVTAFRFFLNAEPALRAAALDAIHASLAADGVLIANVHVNSRCPRGLAYRARNALLGRSVARTLGLAEFRGLVESRGFAVREVHRYSYLPRPGPWCGGLVRRAMRPVESICRRSRLVPGDAAECFLLVCTPAERRA